MPVWLFILRICIQFVIYQTGQISQEKKEKAKEK